MKLLVSSAPLAGYRRQRTNALLDVSIESDAALVVELADRNDSLVDRAVIAVDPVGISVTTIAYQ
jgi:hypothetical protein